MSPPLISTGRTWTDLPRLSLTLWSEWSVWYGRVEKVRMWRSEVKTLMLHSKRTCEFDFLCSARIPFSSSPPPPSHTHTHTHTHQGEKPAEKLPTHHHYSRRELCRASWSHRLRWLLLPCEQGCRVSCDVYCVCACVCVCVHACIFLQVCWNEKQVKHELWKLYIFNTYTSYHTCLASTVGSVHWSKSFHLLESTRWLTKTTAFYLPSWLHNYTSFSCDSLLNFFTKKNIIYKLGGNLNTVQKSEEVQNEKVKAIVQEYKRGFAVVF